MFSFCRSGRVQSVKILGKKDGESTEATVAFMDIKSANKAHCIEHKVEDRILRTDYYDPTSTPTPGASLSSSEAANERLSGGVDEDGNVIVNNSGDNLRSSHNSSYRGSSSGGGRYPDDSPYGGRSGGSSRRPPPYRLDS